jgi:heme-degrading monooxygenase HmoA
MKHYVYIWEFDVLPHYLAEFLRCYGPDGDWARLFRRSEGYLGTLLLKDERQPMRYVTVDRWISRESHDAFRARFGEAYDALDRQCEAYTSGEASLGSFAQIDGHEERA